MSQHSSSVIEIPDLKMADFHHANKVTRGMKAPGDLGLKCVDVSGQKDTVLLTFTDAANMNARGPEGTPTHSQAG